MSQAQNASFLFHRDFMDYHKHKFEDHSLLVFKAEKLIGIMPANKDGNSLYSHQGLTYGGFIIDDSLKFTEVLAAFKAILVYLEAQQIDFLNIKTLPSIYAQSPREELEYLMFILEAQLYRRDLLSVIDYRAQPKKMSAVRKRGLKRAQEQGLIVKEQPDFDVFWQKILVPNLNAKYNIAPVHSLDEIGALQKRFPANIRQFNVYKDDEIVAGTTIFETHTTAHAQYISANDNKQELGSLDFLFDHLIQTEFNTKKYFDFGISNENNGKNINTGLLYWKESFGARSLTHDFYKIETSNHKLLDKVLL